MDFGMCRRVLLVLMVAWKGALSAEGTNKDIFGKLCKITGMLKGLMEKDKGAKSTLHEALYGGNGELHFDENGTFKGNCGSLGGLHHRSTYCSHMGGGYKTINENGCFGHSLMGTLFCLCTKGTNGDEDLCGLGSVGNGARWVSGLPPSDDMFQKVWKKINETCTENNTTAGLENLQTVVKETHDGAKKNKVKNDYFTLGSTTTHGVCGGTHKGDACVTYTGNSTFPYIPWAEKILSAIQSIKEAKKHASSTNIPPADHHHENPEDPSGHEQVDDQESEEESEEESVENTSSPNPSKPPRTRRKRRSTTTKKSAEQNAESLKAIIHKNDGTFLPQPFWLISAVVI